MNGKQLKRIIEDFGRKTADCAITLGHASRNSTTAIYIERDQCKVDEANRRVIDWVLYGKR